MMYGVYRPTLTNPNLQGKFDVMMKLVVGIEAQSPEQALRIAKASGHHAPVIGQMRPEVH